MKMHKREVTDAIQAMCYLFSLGSAYDIEQFLTVAKKELLIHNMASPDNEQVSWERLDLY